MQKRGNDPKNAVSWCPVGGFVAPCGPVPVHGGLDLSHFPRTAEEGLAFESHQEIVVVRLKETPAQQWGVWCWFSFGQTVKLLTFSSASQLGPMFLLS